MVHPRGGRGLYTQAFLLTSSLQLHGGNNSKTGIERGGEQAQITLSPGKTTKHFIQHLFREVEQSSARWKNVTKLFTKLCSTFLNCDLCMTLWRCRGSCIGICFLCVLLHASMKDFKCKKWVKIKI